MTELFNRGFKVQIGTVLLSSENPLRPLRVVFEVQRSLSSEANKCTAQIFNLNADNRKRLETEVGEKRSQIDIEAGYGDQLRLLFRGSVTQITTTRTRTEWVSSIQAGDGIVQKSAPRFSGSKDSTFGPEASSYKDLLPKLAKRMGVGLGNLDAQLAKKAFRGGLEGFAKGVAFTGKASDALDRVMAAAGFEWSIQDGELRVLRPGEGVRFPTTPIIAAATGMIGSPEGGEKGVVTARSLLRGDLLPGDIIELRVAQAARRTAAGESSQRFAGLYRIQRLTHSGDTWGDDWTTAFELEPTVSLKDLPKAEEIPGDETFTPFEGGAFA